MNIRKIRKTMRKARFSAEILKILESRKKLTEMQLGKMIGKSRKFISLIEYPRYGKEINLDSLFDISRALDVDIYYFFIGIE